MVCLFGSLPSESGGGREPGSMSFPCGTISASRKLPFPGDFCGDGEECPRVTLRPPGLGGRGWGPGVTQGPGSAGPRGGRGEGAAGRGVGRGRAWRTARRSRCRRCRALAGPSIRLSSSAPSGRSLRPHRPGPARGQRPGGGGCVRTPSWEGSGVGVGKGSREGQSRGSASDSKTSPTHSGDGEVSACGAERRHHSPPAKGGPTCSWEPGSPFRLLSAALLCPSSVT